jgi:Flp pilus assembly protein TadG
MRLLGRRRKNGQRGQSLVEFVLIVPVFMTLALAIAEFGVAFGTNMTLVEATREGARTGAILTNGSKTLGCTGAVGAASVDPQVIAAVQRAIEAPGTGININQVTSIVIYKANGGGSNTWTRGTGPSICGTQLHFVQGAVGWQASARSNTLPADPIGVSITYKHKLFTPLSALTGLFGLNEIVMTDFTVMDLEP